MSIFTGSAMLPTACTERLLSITPCAYPLLSDTVHCGIDDADLRRNVRVCDPDKAISMSEVKVIKDKLDTIYNRKDKYCVCRKDQLRPCWFRFGFAFLRQMLPVESGVSHLYSREFCPANETLLRYTKNNAVIHSTRESVTHYGKNFARLLRERWLMGECEEDILFLVLLRRPDSLVNRVTLPYVASRAVHRTPYIFASYGSLVREKIDTLNLVDENFPLNYHQADPLQKIVEAENANLENGYSLKAFLPEAGRGAIIRSFCNDVNTGRGNVRVTTCSKSYPRLGSDCFHCLCLFVLVNGHRFVSDANASTTWLTTQ